MRAGEQERGIMNKRSNGENRRTGLSKGSCVVVVQGSPEYAGRRPTDAQRTMVCENNPGNWERRGRSRAAVVVRDDIQALC